MAVRVARGQAAHRAGCMGQQTALAWDHKGIFVSWRRFRDSMDLGVQRTRGRRVVWETGHHQVLLLREGREPASVAFLSFIGHSSVTEPSAQGQGRGDGDPSKPNPSTL